MGSVVIDGIRIVYQSSAAVPPPSPAALDALTSTSRRPQLSASRWSYQHQADVAEQFSHALGNQLILRPPGERAPSTDSGSPLALGAATLPAAAPGLLWNSASIRDVQKQQ